MPRISAVGGLARGSPRRSASRWLLPRPRGSAVSGWGAVNVLGGGRAVGQAALALVAGTRERCYANPAEASPGRRFVEDDALGGRDPYSSSKACAELVV